MSRDTNQQTLFFFFFGATAPTPLAKGKHLITITQSVSLQNPLPGEQQRPVLKVCFMVQKEKVSVFGLPVTDERFVQNFHFHLRFGRSRPADGHQQPAAPPAQHGQQHV